MTAGPGTAIQAPTYRYLNTGDGWPGLAVDGVWLDTSGRLTLPAVPGPPSPAPDPGQACDVAMPSPSAATGPRGYRYVVVPDDGLLRVVEPASGQAVAAWGPLARPVAVVADHEAVYVAEVGAGAVSRFDADGVRDEAWQAALSAWAGPITARRLQLARLGGEQELVMLAADAGPATRVLVATPAGTRDDVRTAAWNALATRRRDPRTGAWASVPVGPLTGLAADPGGDRLYVVSGGAVLCFDLAGHWVGQAETGPDVFCEDVAVDSGGGTRLLVAGSAGGASAGQVLVLDPEGARTRAGSFVCGPISTGVATALWQESRTDAEVAAGTGMSLWTLSGPDPAPPGVDTLPGDVSAPSLLPWTAVAGDGQAALVGSEPARYLWLGGVLTGDGSATPALSQVRVDVATPSWLSRLPALYAEPGPASDFLDHMLRWMESALRDHEDGLQALPVRLDPWAVPDDRAGFTSSALDELAGWLGITIDERWPEERRRAVTAEAYGLHAIRGTPDGLARLLGHYLDAPATVTDASAGTSIWVLDDDTMAEPAALGLSTMLAASSPQGTVADVTAALDGSALSDGTGYGAALFEDVAHEICVQVYAADLQDPGDQDTLRSLVEAEKPAHLGYHLCLVEAKARAGFQARVGVDAIVAPPPGDLVLDANGLGTDSVLSREATGPGIDPAREPRAGTAVLGRGLRLT
jgi:phage tail-like protein